MYTAVKTIERAPLPNAVTLIDMVTDGPVVIDLSFCDSFEVGCANV